MSKDLRPARTKRLLTEALVELAETKSIMKVTVSELSTAADVNRATFYRHYPTMEAFVEELEDDLLDGLVDAHELDRAGDARETTYYREWLRFARDNRSLFEALLSANGASEFEHRLVKNGADAWKYLLRPGQVDGLDETSAGYLATYVTSAHIGILTRWLEGGCTESLEVMSALMYRMSVDGVLKFCGVAVDPTAAV